MGRTDFRDRYHITHLPSSIPSLSRSCALLSSTGAPLDDRLAPPAIGPDVPNTVGLALRRWRRQTEAGYFGQPTASVGRWRLSVLP